MACCQFCTAPIPPGSGQVLHARCANVLRNRVEPTTREYRLYVPSRTIKRERDLLARYDAEQKAIKEVPAGGPGQPALNTERPLQARHLSGAYSER